MKNTIIKPNEGIRKIFEYDINKFKKYVSSLEESDWSKWTERQKPNSNHQYTQSIKIQWIPLDVSFYEKEKTEYIEPHYSSVNQFLNPLINFLEKHYSGKIYKIILVRLKPFSEIKAHVDSSFSLTHTHRNHIPILTNDKVFFSCSNNIQNMKEGSVYEIDNLSTHWVRNESEWPRIHLIIDVIENAQLMI